MELSTTTINPVIVPISNEDKIFSLLDDAYAVASVGIAMMKAMEDFLPKAATTVENASFHLADQFMTLTQNLQGHETQGAAANKAIQEITVGMQFQDRNSQLTHNAVGMMARYRALLESLQNKITSIDGDIDNDIVKSAVEEISSSIRLSDVRRVFQEMLAKVDLAVEIQDAPVSENDSNDIELF